jgi:hypothetical protein
LGWWSGRWKRYALFYPGVGDERVNHEVTVSMDDKPFGRGGTDRRGGGTYTWLRERESEERLKASDEGAGAGMAMNEMRRSKEEGKYQRRYEEMEMLMRMDIYSSDFVLRRIGMRGC